MMTINELNHRESKGDRYQETDQSEPQPIYLNVTCEALSDPHHDHDAAESPYRYEKNVSAAERADPMPIRFPGAVSHVKEDAHRSKQNRLRPIGAHAGEIPDPDGNPAGDEHHHRAQDVESDHASAPFATLTPG